MLDSNFILLYVDRPEASADFYTGLLGKTPVERSPTFALFVLASGMKLGLWSKHTVEPAAPSAFGGAELAFQVDDHAKVDAVHADWAARGLPIAQAPTDLDFGRSFVALDPDGHRLRVYSRAPE